MAKKLFRKNVNISPKETVTCENFFNINKKDKFVTEEKNSGY